MCLVLCVFREEWEEYFEIHAKRMDNTLLEQFDFTSNNHWQHLHQFSDLVRAHPLPLGTYLDVSALDETTSVPSGDASPDASDSRYLNVTQDDVDPMSAFNVQIRRQDSIRSTSTPIEHGADSSTATILDEPGNNGDVGIPSTRSTSGTFRASSSGGIQARRRVSAPRNPRQRQRRRYRPPQQHNEHRPNATAPITNSARPLPPVLCTGTRETGTRDK